MPKGFKGFQKGHKSFWTDELKKKASENHPRYWLGKKRDDPEYLKKISEAHKGQHSSPSTEFKPTGCKGRELLGDKVYRNLHYWVERKLGKPTKCEQCGKDVLTSKQIHWANKSGEYKKDVNDWVRLCVRCHFYKDRK
uniref:Uncharacterized protein n=1 Tax=viral metagenome TaxID=1070528 RepID=A0A6H1ZQ02_9ZZZZ